MFCCLLQKCWMSEFQDFETCNDAAKAMYKDKLTVSMCDSATACRSPLLSPPV
jgi:hypothetical protein